MRWFRRKAAEVDTLTQPDLIHLPNVSGSARNEEIYPANGYYTYAIYGYGRNEVVYACIRERASSMTQAKLRVYETGTGGEALDSHHLRRLLARPNPTMSESQLIDTTIVHLDLSGSAFWRINRAPNGRPAELWILRPDRVKIYESNRTGYYDYGYVVEEGRDPVFISGDDIIHFRTVNPLDDIVGHPPLRSAARASTLDNHATEFATALLKNYAVPGLVLETPRLLSKDMAQRAIAEWSSMHGGPRAGGVGIAQGGSKVVPLGFNLSDLEFPDLRSVSETRICMVYGVPPILIGAKAGLDRSTFANYSEARRSFWEETLMPLQRLLLDTIAHKLVPEFTRGLEPNVELRWDNSEVIALRESERDRFERVSLAFSKGLITRDEARAQLALPHGNDEDKVYAVPAGVTLVGEDGEPKFGELTRPETSAEGDDNGQASQADD